MENISGYVKEDDQMDLPPGFRFHPTDEELISHYLYKKVIDASFTCGVIGEVDLNKSEPWDLPWKAKMGEKEWYFFCVRDRKYPTGLRTNRATGAGYWKATGKDKEIVRDKSLVGMKKTLVFYTGRAPKGEKSNWVIHEFRLEGKLSPPHLPKTAKSEWVICRVFHKSAGGRKFHISELIKLDPSGNLPPLTDSSPALFNAKHHLPPNNDSSSSYVPCFSNLMVFDNNPLKPLPELLMADSFTNFRRIPYSNSVPPPPLFSNLQFQPSSVLMQDQSVLKKILTTEREKRMMVFNTSYDHNNNDNMNMNGISSSSRSHINQQQAPSTSSATPLDLDSIWNY